jgi:hypothetical protein
MYDIEQQFQAIIEIEITILEGEELLFNIYPN